MEIKKITRYFYIRRFRHSLHVHRQPYADDLQTRPQRNAPRGIQPPSCTELDKTEPRC
jgi:hypothetical protein